MRDSQVPIDMAAVETRLQNAAWQTKPSYAVIATDDKAFHASYAVSMTQPRVVASVIERAARSVASSTR